MVQDLNNLKSGKLKGSKTLKLACGLTTFPEEILTLANTLEVLDLSDNNLSTLPDSIAELKQLRIVFFARNKFREFPSVLAKCPNLNMIGFKTNQIKKVSEHAFPPKLNWLILTDNKIEKLPKSIGGSILLQKCALAGNLIEELPAEMANCVNLELLRVSANQLKTIPNWLFDLPKLSWVAFGGNPAAYQIKKNNNLESFSWQDFKVKELLGEGASGFISKANWISKKQDVAIKVFKGAVTSDGLPEVEMEIAIAAGNHQNLIPILGKIKAHPEGKSGLVMQLITSNYINLGNPPSLKTCTRDTFNTGCTFTENELLTIAKSIASVSQQLHKKGINHGDLYAHNILINTNAEPILGDFGAASFYNVNTTIAKNIERVEVRAFGCLLEDIFNLIDKTKLNKTSINKWQELIENCTKPNVKKRLSFSEILETLNMF